MKAGDIMSTDVVTVHPDTSVREVARLLLGKHLTALPVIDQKGAPIGMVSEDDLVGPDDSGSRGTSRLMVEPPGRRPNAQSNLS